MAYAAPDSSASTPPEPVIDQLPTWWGPSLDRSVVADELLEATGGAPLDDAQIHELAAQPPRRFLAWQHLGTSRWSSVYVALDLTLDRHVVLKVSRRNVEPEPRLLATLAHPNVVVVHGVEHIQGHVCTIMEWCLEGDLASYARLYPVHDLLARCVEVGYALTHLHTNDIVHGDIKPTNILIHDGRAKLGDFGLARRCTNSGEIAGTPPFVPPERFAGQWQPAGDVFSLAFTVYHCVEVCPNVPASVHAMLQPLLERGCAPLPEQRPTMAEFTATLDELAHEPERAAQRRIALRRHVFAVLMLLLALSFGVIATTLYIPQPEEPTIELAIEYAENGDPLTAWSYFRQADESTGVSTHDALRLTEVLLETAERLSPEEREEAAFIAGRIARQTSFRAKQRGQDDLRERAKQLRTRSEGLLNYRN